MSGVITALALALGPASALADPTPVDSSACSPYSLSQPFMAGQDFNWYASAPGQSANGFAAGGWTLSGGATIVQTKLVNGVTGPVLNLPNGASAVSPAMCLSADYLAARAQIRSLTAYSSGGVSLSVAYQGDTGWGTAVKVGDLGGNNTANSAWMASKTAKLPPAGQSGWQLVRFTLTAGTNDGKGFQVYNVAAQASPGAALASVDTSACTKPELSQALMAGKDFNWYAQGPGQSPDGFDATGWTLSGGATMVQTQLADGRSGRVLNLPNNAKAVSPLMCVNSGYDQVRAQIRSLTASSTGGVTVATAIKGTTSWNNPQTGNLGANNTTWGLSGGADLHAANASGWQLVQFTLTSSTSGKGYQLYNLDARATTGLALSDVDTSACAQHDLSQPFLDGGDSYWYALAPGESTDTFDAGGWTLSGGANIAQAQLADGALGAVLDLPPGAQAVSPFMCVSSDFKLARAQIRNLTAGSGNVTLAAAIQHTTSWNNPHTGNLGGGNGTGWTLSGSVDLQPANAAGWQLVQFTLTNTSSTRESQVYNLATQASDALALASVDTSACVPPQLSQPFLFAGDTRWYTPTPGESSAGLDGTGWTLSGGAGIVQGQLPNGSTGPVLDLPAGSQAVTPVMCVNQDYPLARAHMRPVSGDGTVGMYVAYKGTSSWNNPDHSADLHGPNSGWGLSGTGNINPGKTPGWQLVQITLQAGAKGGSQVYDFEIDPRMSH